MPQSSIIVDPDLPHHYSDYASSIENTSNTTSITSSALIYPYENGRRYHSYHEGEYLLPNDEMEQDRLDLTHHIYLMIMNGALHLAPVKTPARVLDLGTGTGIWAIDFSDLNRRSLVNSRRTMVTSLGLHLHTAGVDLSPIQPLWIPPNCRFEVDNYELSWPYNEPFDYIHGRELEGAIRDHKQLFRQAFDNLNPNGWFEMAAFEVNTMSDDNTHLKATCLLSSISNIHTSSKIFGKDMTSVSSWRRWMIKAGFVNVKEDGI